MMDWGAHALACWLRRPRRNDLSFLNHELTTNKHEAEADEHHDETDGFAAAKSLNRYIVKSG